MAKKVTKRTVTKTSKSKSTVYKLSPGFRPKNGNRPAFLYVPLPAGYTYTKYSDFKFTPYGGGSSDPNYEVVGNPVIVGDYYLEIKFKKKANPSPGGKSKKSMVAPITGSFTITIEYKFGSLTPSETYDLPAIVFDD